jgi:uncharacterized protein (TIGR03000 family)
MRQYLRQVLAAGVIVAAFAPAYAGGASKTGHGSAHGSSHPGSDHHPYYRGYNYYGAWPYGYYVADYGPTVVVNDPDNGTPTAADLDGVPPPPPERVALRTSAATSARPAEIRIRTAPNARLWIDGQATTRTGAVRTFATPPLESGKTYSYKVRACWLENGQPAVRSRTVEVTPGETVELDLR